MLLLFLMNAPFEEYLLIMLGGFLSRVKEEETELSTIYRQFKLRAPDRKMRETDCVISNENYLQQENADLPLLIEDQDKK